MWRNSVVTAVLGLLLGFFAGYLLGQQQPQPVSSAAGDPHAGIPGAPPLPGMGVTSPGGGTSGAAVNARLAEQAREIERLLAADPQNYTLLVEMGNVLYDLAMFARAAEYYERARVLRDDNPDVLTDLGVCYRETNRPALAIELFDRAADISDRHWQSRYNAAVVRLFDLNDARGAREEIDKLNQLRSKMPEIPDLAGIEAEIARRLR